MQHIDWGGPHRGSDLTKGASKCFLEALFLHELLEASLVLEVQVGVHFNNSSQLVVWKIALFLKNFLDA